jgi:chemotaxis response regulator CheB
MAATFGERSVGVVLSGAGSDGTAGLQAIKAAGGLTLVQNPESARYPSMPQSAIVTGIVDRVMEAADMAGFIAHYAGRLHFGGDVNEGVPEAFIAGLSEPGQYLGMIRGDDAERIGLIKDLLIKVTDFLRDSAASGLSTILKAEGCEVVQRDSAKAALEALEDFRPEAMLIDIGLGDGDGCDLLQDIVARYGDGAVSVAITVYGHEEARQRTAAAGFDHHLTKPPDIARLLEILSRSG